MPPARHPIWIKSYIPTKLDGLLFIEAYLRKNSFLCGPEDNDSRVANGFIFVYEHSAGFEELNELGCWKVIDFDGIFEISQSTDSSGLMRKKAIVSVDEIQLCLESYYKPWDTVNGNLVPPTRCVDFQNVNLRPGLATQDNLNTRSPMETIRLAIEALKEYQSHFIRLGAYLILSTTDDSYHDVFLEQDQKLLFPYLPSDQSYWMELSTSPTFAGKTPCELQSQSFVLLYMLMCLAAGTSLPRGFEASPDFLPLQNMCLYFEAFRIEARPLGALQPLNEKSLVETFRKSRLFPFDTMIQPQMMESWDSYLRKNLPIDCLRDEVDLPPAFVTLFAYMGVTDRIALRMGTELLCEKFPRFRDTKYRHLLLLHQCFHSSTDKNFMTTLSGWIYTRDGEHTIYQVFQVFQTDTEPEVLALALADLFLLWILDPPHDDPQPRVSNLFDLEMLLSGVITLKSSYYLLLDLFASFRVAIMVLKSHRSTAIMQFLSGSVCIVETAWPVEDLTIYLLRRLTGESSDRTAQAIAAVIEAFIGCFVVLRGDDE